MANAILLNQSTNLTKDNILDTLNKNVISDITFENNILTVTYVNDNAEDKEISLPLDTIQKNTADISKIQGDIADISTIRQNASKIDSKINKVTGNEISGKIPQLTSGGQLSATNILTSQIVTFGNRNDVSYEPIE